MGQFTQLPIETVEIPLSGAQGAAALQKAHELPSVAEINTLQTEVDDLIAGQTGGVIVFATYALLDAYTPTTVDQEVTSYKVTNDADSSLNGYYAWTSGTAYTKDAELVANVIDPNNTSEGVSGFAVSQPLKYKADLEVGVNKFDKLTRTLLTFPDDDNDGVLAASATRDTTDFIPVEGSTAYVFSDPVSFGSYFDVNFNWIAGGFRNVVTSTTTSPATARYLRFAIDQSDIDAFMFSAPSIPANYTAYMLQVPSAQLLDINARVDLIQQKENDWNDPNLEVTYPFYGASGSESDVNYLKSNLLFQYQIRSVDDGVNKYALSVVGVQSSVRYNGIRFSNNYLSNVLGWSAGDQLKLGYWIRFPSASPSATRRHYYGLVGGTPQILTVNSPEWVWVNGATANLVLGAGDWQGWDLGWRDTDSATEQFHLRGLTLVNVENDSLIAERESLELSLINSTDKSLNLNPFASFIPSQQGYNGENPQLRNTSEQNGEPFTKAVETITYPIAGNCFAFTGAAATRFRLNFESDTEKTAGSTIKNIFDIPANFKNKYFTQSLWCKVDADVSSFIFDPSNNTAAKLLPYRADGFPTGIWIKLSTVPVLVTTLADVEALEQTLQIDCTPSASTVVIRIAGLTTTLTDSPLYNSINLETIASTSWLNSKKYTSYGDSITATGVWPNYIANAHSMESQVRGIGGTTAHNNGSIAWVTADGNYIDRPPSAAPAGTEGVDYFEITSSMCTQERVNTIPADSDLITVMMGTNDWGQDLALGTISDAANDAASGAGRTFYASCKSVIDKIQIRSVDARVVLCNITSIASGDNVATNANSNTVEQFRQAIRDMGVIYGLPVIETSDLGVNAYNYARYLSDTTHPNSEYDKLIGKKVARIVFNLGYDEAKAN